jgi:DNA repair exonuclease SbcCD ATPase subunit
MSTTTEEFNDRISALERKLESMQTVLLRLETGINLMDISNTIAFKASALELIQDLVRDLTKAEEELGELRTRVVDLPGQIAERVRVAKDDLDSKLERIRDQIDTKLETIKLQREEKLQAAKTDWAGKLESVRAHFEKVCDGLASDLTKVKVKTAIISAIASVIVAGLLHVLFEKLGK